MQFYCTENRLCQDYLLQRRVGDPEAAEAHVGERLLQLPEQTGVRPMLEALTGEQVGQLLADGLDQLGFGDVVMDEAGDALHIPWGGRQEVIPLTGREREK